MGKNKPSGEIFLVAAGFWSFVVVGPLVPAPLVLVCSFLLETFRGSWARACAGSVALLARCMGLAAPLAGGRGNIHTCVFFGGASCGVLWAALRGSACGLGPRKDGNDAVGLCVRTRGIAAHSDFP